MRRIVGACALLAAACPAWAADYGGMPPGAPIAPVVRNWSGLYAGVNAGYLWSKTDTLGPEPHGFAGGVQAGYNLQFGQFVIGAEADLQLSGADDRFAAYKFSNPWFGTARGRFGYAFSSMLVYATVGLAAGGGRLDIAGLSESDTHFGWSGGAGVELGLTSNWSTKAEYVFIGLDNKTYVLSGANLTPDVHFLRLGVNYRF
jgi:outer membrane immunogenic protein